MISNRIWGLILSALVMLSAGISIFAYWLEPVISRDGVLYLGFVKQWCEEDLSLAVLGRWIPVFPFWLMKMLHCCGMPLELTGIVLNIVLRSMIPLIVFAVAMELEQSKKLALASALILAVHPSLTKLAIEPQRDIVYLFFSGLIIWFTLASYRRKKWYYAAAAGVASSAALLSRTEALELFPIWGLLILILWFKERDDWKIHAVNMLYFAAGLIAGLLLLFSVINMQYKNSSYHKDMINTVKAAVNDKKFLGERTEK